MTKPVAYRAATYAWMVPRLTEIAREHGYALGLHGSLHRDLDLIAVPWVDEVSSPETLIEALRESISGLILPTGTKGGRFDPASGTFVEAIIESPSHKPHGRLAWNIHLDGGLFIDISVMQIPPSSVRPSLVALFAADRSAVLRAFSTTWLNGLLPGIDRLIGCEQDPHDHPEGDVAIHTSLVLENFKSLCHGHLGRSPEFVELLAALIHDWKKPVTQWIDRGRITFPGHEALAAAEVPRVAAALGLTEAETAKLQFLVGEHGNMYLFDQLPADQQAALLASPHIESLRLFTQADAASCVST